MRGRLCGAGVLLVVSVVAGCSSPASVKAPSVTFGSMATTPGMPDMSGMPGISHTYLYIHGYQHIPMIGDAFLVQVSISFALALLILIGGPWWLQWAAAAVAGGALVAFALSRTVGLFSFSETGWQPSPHAVISVAAELLTVGLWAVCVLDHRRPPKPPA
jgi:hypothetical protein